LARRRGRPHDRNRRGAFARRAGDAHEHGCRERLARTGAREGRLHHVGHLLAQQPAPAGDPLPSGILGQIELPGHLLDGLLLAIEEDQGLPQGLGDLGQRLLDNGLLLLDHGGLLRSGFLRWHIRGGVQGSRPSDHVALAVAEPVLHGAAGDAAKPGAELAEVLELAQAPPRPEKDLLSQLLALFHTAGGTISDGTYQGLIPAHQDPECLRAALETRPDQVIVVLRSLEHRKSPVTADHCNLFSVKETGRAEM
jgi:hypothetical protein